MNKLFLATDVLGLGLMCGYLWTANPVPVLIKIAITMTLIRVLINSVIRAGDTAHP